MSDIVRRHYEKYPYPVYPLFASIRRCDTYALNLEALWSRYRGELPPAEAKRILIAGCGSFAPYPFAIANPDIAITALDLSRANLRRARLHCLLHGVNNIEFMRGDLLGPQVAGGPYGFIDCYGVLHHLQDPLAGLKALAERLAHSGIIRIMVYSRYARREEESIRRAFRITGISDAATVKRVLKQARAGSRLHGFASSSYEARSLSGLADALLHPCVKTFRIDEFLEMIELAGLKVLEFIHSGAVQETAAEIDRIRQMEKHRESPGNFVAHLGLAGRKPELRHPGTVFRLNRCLEQVVRRPPLKNISIPSRLGQPAPLLGRKERIWLKKFITPVRAETLGADELKAAEVYSKALFLLHYSE